VKKRHLVIMYVEDITQDDFRKIEETIFKFLNEKLPDIQFLLTDKKIETLSREDLRRILEAKS
jgi:hypothetical protein